MASRAKRGKRTSPLRSLLSTLVACDCPHYAKLCIHQCVATGTCNNAPPPSPSNPPPSLLPEFIPSDEDRVEERIAEIGEDDLVRRDWCMCVEVEGEGSKE